MNYDVLYLGIDVSKLKHDLAVMTEHKKLLGKTLVIPESSDGYWHLSQRLTQFRQTFQTRLFYVGMEATSDYWKNLFHFFRSQPDCQVTVINPVQTNAFTKTELRRAKTDPVSAKDIARYLVEKKPASSYFRPPILENLKDLDTQIRSLVKIQTMATNRLRIELSKVAPEIEQAFGNIRGQQILAVLNAFPTAKMIENASLEQLRQIRFGQKQWRIRKSLALKLKQFAQNSIAYKSGTGAGWVVQALIRNIAHYQTEVDYLKEQIRQLYEHAQSNNANILMTINAISKESAIIFDAYFGDIHRFKNKRAFVAYFGMNPTVNQSGKRIHRKSYLQKKGSGHIRRQLFLIVLNLIRKQQEPFYSYYQHLIAAGKPKLVAIGAVMRKLLVIMFEMLKSKQNFNPNKK